MDQAWRLQSLGIGLSAALWAGIAFASPPLVTRAAPCVEASDLPICLLRVTAADDAGSNLARDRELAARPEILAAAGVTPEGIARYRASEKGLVGQVFYEAEDRANKAFLEALAADRAGRPPAESLAIIGALPGDAPTLPPFFADSQETSAKLIAYRRVVVAPANTLPVGPPPSDALVVAALRAWEEDLAARGGLADSMSSPSSLASAYAERGDTAGVRRAIALEPRPEERIRILIKLDRADEARQALAKLTRADLELSVREELMRKARFQHRTALEAAVAADALIQEEIVKYRAAGQDTRVFENLRKENARQITGLSRTEPTVPARLIRGEATRRLEDVQEVVLGADAPQRPRRPDDPRIVTDPAVIARLREQNNQPRVLLRQDIEQGRGLAKLNEYLAQVPDAEQNDLLRTCTDAATLARQFNLIWACVDRMRPNAGAPRDLLAFSESMTRYASQAYVLGYSAKGRALLTRGLTAAHGLDTDQPSYVQIELIEIAKAELRASDRLPPRPSGQMMLGRAP